MGKVSCGTPLSGTKGVLETKASCESLVPVTPCSKGAEASPCAEDHTLEIVTTEYAAALKVSNKWTVPACNQTAELTVPGLRAAHIGSFLWSADYGAFEIVSFNPGANTLLVRNPCILGNVSPGTIIPAANLFILTPPPLDIAANLISYVTANFIVPAVGNSVTIQVTSTEGIQAGYDIQVGSSRFHVDTVVDEETLQVTNLGFGGAIGSTIYAFNGAGDYQYAVIIVNSSAVFSEEKTGGPLTLNAANPTQELQLAPTQLIVYNNASLNKAAQIFYTVRAHVTGNMQNANSNLAAYNFQLQQAVNGGSILSVVNMNESKYTSNDTQFSESKEVMWAGVASVPPQGSFSLDAKALLTWQGTGTAVYNIDSLVVGASGIVVIS